MYLSSLASVLFYEKNDAGLACEGCVIALFVLSFWPRSIQSAYRLPTLPFYQVFKALIYQLLSLVGESHALHHP